MKKSKLILCVILGLLVAGSLFGAPDKQAGGSGGSFDPSKVKIAYVGGLLNHPTIRLWVTAYLQACKDYGFTQAKVVGVDVEDSAEVRTTMEAFIAEGGQAIIGPYGDNGLDSTIAAAGRRGIFVGVTHFNHVREDGTNPPGYSFGMACDPSLYGAEAAEAIAKKLNGRTGSIAITQNARNITENAASDAFIKAWNGPLQSKYNIKGIKILPIQLEGAMLDQAVAVNLAIIQSNPDLIGAFGTTGGSPVSWGDAAQKAGKQPGEICIIGMDATEGNLDYLEQGKVYGIVAQPGWEEHYQAVEYMVKLFKGEKVPVWTTLPAPIVTKDGTGVNGLAYHKDIASRVKEFFKD
jgi:ribose transport system substrate-binding protein